MDMRLKTAKWEFDGQPYELCCNMAVLADVQEEYKGKFALALTGSLKSYMVILAAMINDSADEQGLDKHYSWRQIARHYTGKDDLLRIKDTIIPLVNSALAAEDTGEPEEKNE
jgi:hypothetical protein